MAIWKSSRWSPTCYFLRMVDGMHSEERAKRAISVCGLHVTSFERLRRLKRPSKFAIDTFAPNGEAVSTQLLLPLCDDGWRLGRNQNRLSQVASLVTSQIYRRRLGLCVVVKVVDGPSACSDVVVMMHKPGANATERTTTLLAALEVATRLVNPAAARVAAGCSFWIS
jgi:hypothetical protein